MKKIRIPKTVSTSAIRAPPAPAMGGAEGLQVLWRLVPRPEPVLLCASIPGYLTYCALRAVCQPLPNAGECICHRGFEGKNCSSRTLSDCPAGYAGPECHACEEDSYSQDCQHKCNPRTTCSGNGRCRGLTGAVAPCPASRARAAVRKHARIRQGTYT